MNKRILQKASRQKYRKYALRISLIAHVVMFLTIPFIFIQQQIQEMEDEIAVELIPPKWRLIDPPHQAPVTPPPPVPKIEMPKIELEIAKLPASAAAVEIEQPTSQNIDVDTPILETQDLATDAHLEPTIDSVLSPKVSADVRYGQSSYTKRRDTGVKSPTKNTGEGIRKGTKKTGAATGNDISDLSDIRSTGNGSGNGGGNDSATFSSVIAELTDNIIASSGGLPIDVVFVVDASASMQDNIRLVAEHLGQMVDAYKAAEIDYQLGLTYFNVDQSQNNIHVFQLTRDLSTYKDALYAIPTTGDENALDAIHQTVRQMRFRTNTIKHLILVTDESFTSLQGHSVDTIIQLCQRNELYVNVIGLRIPNHRRIAAETDGSWHAVPEESQGSDMGVAQIVQSAVNAQTIGNIILADGANNPVDIILFIDGSKSMKDKIPYITEQIDMWIRTWDNANIEYRLGVVQFRTKQDVNIVNVFKPPQTQAQIHSILRLPCKDDENLHYAVKDAIRRLKQRTNAKTHFILITDEPGDLTRPIAATFTTSSGDTVTVVPTRLPQPIAATIEYLKELPVTVHVIGTTDNFQQQVASQTGGVFVKMPNAHNINSGDE